MSRIGNALDEMMTKLQNIPGIKTVDIGLEKGIGSKDSPFIRIIHESNTEGKANSGGSCRSTGYDNATVQIIFGFDLKNTQLRELTHKFLDLEEDIRSVILTKYDAKCHAKFLHTHTDEDRLPTIKSAITRFELIGIR